MRVFISLYYFDHLRGYHQNEMKIFMKYELHNLKGQIQTFENSFHLCDIHGTIETKGINGEIGPQRTNEKYATQYLMQMEHSSLRNSA